MEEKQINKILKEGKGMLITTIVFLILTLGLLGASFYIPYSETMNPQNLAEIDEKAGEYVKIKVTYGPYGFAQDSDDSWYYFVWDENDVMYIVKVEEDTYQEMLALYEDGQKEKIDYEIKGYTYSISSSLKKVAIEAVNEIYKDAEEKVTYSNFSTYLGAVYIDETESPENDTVNTLQAIAIVSGMFLVVFGGIFISQKISSHKVTGNKELMEELRNELADLIDYEYGKLKIYLTNKYIISKTGGISVFEYKNVVWVYNQIRYVNGAAQGRTLILCTKDKKRHSVAYAGANDARVDEIMIAIHDKNENVRVGFTKENREYFKNLQKEVM